jgi:hypothetical protein
MPTHGNVAVPLRHSRRRPPMTAVLLAHEGGWDEMLLVLVPLAAVGALLAVARRRVRGARGVDSELTDRR